ncbi:MAG: carboxypeptidase-like regulatory domain-containing protein [Nitrospiraceae bacterium]|nr:carboxypeptidase-like regulatory domain-containing protein [Nitrospiraceae bacterium]
MKKWLVILSVLALWAALFAGIAEADGTLAATFVYNGSGVSQPLSGAYVYLHAYPQGTPIMQEYFRNAQYVLGPSDANGNISVSVPEGTYRMMIMRRAPLSATPTQAQAYGPPRGGDYTWYSVGSTVTITTGSVINMGTLYASIFGQPVTISGAVKGASGKALAGWFVKATIAPCKWEFKNTAAANDCGPVKYAALSPTDSNGNYTIKIKTPGTYYVYACPGPGDTCRGYPQYPYTAANYLNYNGGFPTCSTAVNVQVAFIDNYNPAYWNCPISVSGSVANVNVSVPGY